MCRFICCMRACRTAACASGASACRGTGVVLPPPCAPAPQVNGCISTPLCADRENGVSQTGCWGSSAPSGMARACCDGKPAAKAGVGDAGSSGTCCCALRLTGDATGDATGSEAETALCGCEPDTCPPPSRWARISNRLAAASLSAAITRLARAWSTGTPSRCARQPHECLIVSLHRCC